MFNNLSKFIVEHCSKEKNSSEIELYIFGINQGLNILLNIITALFIGILFGEVLQAFLFMFSYIPLRSYAGGYHAKTPLRCYIFSVAMLTIVAIGIKYLYIPDLVCYFTLTVATVIVLLFSPVENKNKPLDKIEHKIYKRKVKFITTIEVTICLMFKLIGLESLFIVVIYSFVIVSLMLAIGKVKNYSQLKKNL